MVCCRERDGRGPERPTPQPSVRLPQGALLLSPAQPFPTPAPRETARSGFYHFVASGQLEHENILTLEGFIAGQIHAGDGVVCTLLYVGRADTQRQDGEEPCPSAGGD